MIIKRIITLTLLLLIIHIGVNTTFATENHAQENITHKNISSEAILLQEKILLAKEDLELLKHQDIPTNRYKSLLNSTTQLLSAQIALEEAGGTPDYQIISERINELINIKDTAIRSQDELQALENAIKEFENAEDELLKRYIVSARDEFETERFELVLEEIDKAYVRMSELEAFETKIRAAYEATTRTITNFIWNIRHYLMAMFVLLGIMFLLGRKQFRKYKIRKKIRNLEFRKEVIKDLIAKAQKEYFEDNTLSEAVYHIRTKKYAELIRDINRQKPLLEEQLAMINKKKKTK